LKHHLVRKSEIGRILQSQIPKSEISDWTAWAARRLDGGCDDPAEFLVFRDNCGHFVAGKQTIGHDLLQP
jgi:hypothetical protein